MAKPITFNEHGLIDNCALFMFSSQLTMNVITAIVTWASARGIDVRRLSSRIFVRHVGMASLYRLLSDSTHLAAGMS